MMAINRCALDQIKMKFPDPGTNQHKTEVVQQGGGYREITFEVLLRATKLSVGKHEHLLHYLKRITHLTLNGDVGEGLKTEKYGTRSICKIQNLHHCPNLKVLYLYDNVIKTIENLNVVTQLTHLHLQNNCLQRMENLEPLKLLEKLYLENNNIVKLEGLKGCFQLQKLYLANQKVPIEMHFLFEEDTLRTLACSLQVLDLSNCRVVSAKPLLILRCLEQLDLSKNLICDLEDIFALVGGVASLVELDLRGNQVTLIAKYREKIITLSSARLTLLDKKSVDFNQRSMMQSHLAHKNRKHPEVRSRLQNDFSSKDRRVKLSNSTQPLNHNRAGHQLRRTHFPPTYSTSCHESGCLGIAGASCNPKSSARLQQESLS